MDRETRARIEGAERAAEGKAANTTWELGTQSGEVLAAREEGAAYVRIEAAAAKASK